MKVLIVYDSVYGNTGQIAKAIGGSFTGEVKVIRAEDFKPPELEKVDLFIVGSPTQGGRPTKPVQEFLDKIAESNIKGVKFASFDTRISTKLVGIFGYAAGRIANVLKSKGGILATNPQGYFVKGTQGPLKDGELDRAISWVKGISGTQNPGEE
jgi:flavodoxin I